MNESIQNKINKIEEIALASVSKKDIVGIGVGDVMETDYSDNLTKSIRNTKEAKLFFSELKSAIDLSKEI